MAIFNSYVQLLEVPLSLSDDMGFPNVIPLANPNIPLLSIRMGMAMKSHKNGDLRDEIDKSWSTFARERYQYPQHAKTSMSWSSAAWGKLINRDIFATFSKAKSLSFHHDFQLWDGAERW